LNALALALALAAALAAPKAFARPASGGSDWEQRNASRARAGLLPRKPPPRKRADPSARRAVPLVAPAPTFLGEPVPLPDEPVPAAPASRGEAWLVARGLVTEVTLSIPLDR
jgi:hypothetical protein